MKLYGSFDAELARYKEIAEGVLSVAEAAHLHKDARDIIGRVGQIRADATRGDEGSACWGILYLGRNGTRLPMLDEKHERKQASSAGGKKGAKKRARKAGKWQAAARKLHQENPRKPEEWLQEKLAAMGYLSPQKKNTERLPLDVKTIRDAIKKITP
jgi:hypothetical protein